MAEVARTEGILVLESFADKMTDPFLRAAIELAIDGTEPALITDMMETWLQSMERDFPTKYRKVIEGVSSIQHGDNPLIVEFKLSRIY